MKRSWLCCVLLCLLVIPCTAFEVGADELLHNFAEGFGTRSNCDTLYTTAWWDTVVGDLKLWPFEPDVLGRLLLPPAANGVAVAGNYAYIADGYAGLRIADISNPLSPTVVAVYDTPGFAYDVVVAGERVYIADGTFGLSIVDVSNPTTPVPLGAHNTPGTAYGVTVAGQYAYVADGASGTLQVIDVSDPATPSPVGSCSTSGMALSVAVAGNYAYLAAREGGFQVINIADPTTPAPAASAGTSDWTRDVSVSGNFAYVAEYGAGLTIIDISDPLSLTTAGTCNTPGWALRVTVAGNWVYVADRDSGLVVIDARDHAYPALVGRCLVADAAQDVAVAGTFAFVADRDSGMSVVSAADLIPPLTAGRLPSYDVFCPYDIVISGEQAYVAEGGYGVRVVDITYPDDASLIGECDTDGYAFDLAIDGDYLYVADEDSGLCVLNVSNPGMPYVAGGYVTWEPALGVAVSGDYAFVAMASAGLQAFDVSDPSNPVLADGYAEGYLEDVVIDGELAYAIDGGNFCVFDVSDPTDILGPIGFYTTAGAAKDIAVARDYAYVADGAEGVLVLDVSDPTLPDSVGTFATPGDAMSIDISGDFAFVAVFGTGIMVLNIADPDSPSLFHTFDVPSSYQALAASGDVVCLTDCAGNFRIVQVFQRQFDLSRNEGRSLAFFDSPEEISAVKVVPAQEDSVYWYVSADSGTSWTWVPTDGNWHGLAVPGYDLLWRTEHFYRSWGVNPACDSVDIAWRYNFAEVDSIRDIPEDEGGWVRVRFFSSGRDVGLQMSGQPEPDKTSEGRFEVTQDDEDVRTYGVYRRIDDIGFIDELLERGTRLEEDAPVQLTAGESVAILPAILGNCQAYVLDGRYYYVPMASSDMAVTASFPPGTWEVITSVPATQQDMYYCLVPTRADSMSTFEYSVYCVTAHTLLPTLYFVSPPDSGYSVDNLPPLEPQDLKGDYQYPPAALLLTWDRNSERDFSHYAVYKGDNADFVPGPGNRLGTPWDTSFVDDGFDPEAENYYKVTAWDIHENEGDWALLSPEEITSTEHPPSVPLVSYLEQNVPNPFNPVTVIRFATSKTGRVKLVVYDVTGRPVRVLLQGVRQAGRYEVSWDGRDDDGNRVASGVYVCQLEAPRYSEGRKMVLLQ